MEKTLIYTGSCHCGEIRFEVEADEQIECTECNCSICLMTGFMHLIVPKFRFRLLSGKDALTTYTFNTHVAQHYFCKICGVRPYYIPRSNPDGVDVNVRCLVPAPLNISIVSFDGHNWEQNAHELTDLSRD